MLGFVTKTENGIMTQEMGTSAYERDQLAHENKLVVIERARSIRTHKAMRIRELQNTENLARNMAVNSNDVVSGSDGKIDLMDYRVAQIKKAGDFVQRGVDYVAKKAGNFFNSIDIHHKFK